MENFINDSLYYSFTQVMRFHYTRIHKLLEEVGLYPGQPPVLIILHMKDGQSQKELSEKMDIKPATMTVMLKRMEKSNLIERRQDAEDQRISRVFLTSEGKKALKDVKMVMDKIDEECFKGFTKEEKILLRRLFIQMKDNLIEAGKK